MYLLAEKFYARGCRWSWLPPSQVSMCVCVCGDIPPTLDNQRKIKERENPCALIFKDLYYCNATCLREI